ncbi:unnamed protein product [Brassicogethes aeneus]|uniref:Presequence protease, mitochondrial n=1 Tax=Brassicogethes aeneus TaxID=1431903 RepID=A0A9P0FDW9_BRAAE|nr:unnamed protein product [Brassicogethes aeneus]
MFSRNIINYIKGNSPLKKIIRTHVDVQTIKHKDTVCNIADIKNFTVGQQVHGFQVKEIKNIPEFALTAVCLEHTNIKCQYLHLYRNDSNNVFSINFRTTPLNSTGLPHILEHTVLCGSQQFPVRDPFFKMLNRSLATFMNAMTGSDYTMYPFSTQNESDYRNLQKIYLDAVFKPNLSEFDFMQEGWRLENVDLNDATSKLIIKGIVYNEMKGVFSENENILGQKLQNAILPDHTYGVISGGDPNKIPDLTWDDLKQFHRNHYHPSNCRFYSYGNFSLAPTLEYINETYLKNYVYQETKHTMVPKQPRWTEVKREHITGRFENMRETIEKQNTLSISLLLSDNTDVYETFLMQFVTELLTKGPNSPFYKSMIEPNFSSGFTGSTGFDNQARDCIFSVGLQGLSKDDFEKVINIYEKTIDEVVQTGFDANQIESVLHRYELSIKHETNNFGLGLLFSLSALWNHQGPVVESLQVNNIIQKLKRHIENDPKYLQNVVDQYFRQNKHKLILSMSPDVDFEKKITEQEKQLIEEKVRNLKEEDKRKIHEKCLQLEANQKKPIDTNLLPTLTMQDIGNDVERITLSHTTVNHVPTQINKVNANGIVYFRSLLNTVSLTQEQQMLLPLFCYVIGKLGTEKMNYRDFDSLVNRKTAGLYFNVHTGESLYHLHSYEPGVLISSHCLESNNEAMWELWEQIFTIQRLCDVDRFKMLTQLYMSQLTQGLADMGHVYAMQAASGLVSGSAYQMELLSGLQHISYMKRLLHTSNFKAMLAEISNIANCLFDKNKMRVALNISHDNEGNIIKNYEKFLRNLPSINDNLSIENSYITGKVWAPTDAVHCQHHVLNVPVNYCSKAVLTVPYADPDYAKLRVLAKLLTAKYLHGELREKQGAYGGGARLTSDGVFSFYSYRDPRNLKTLGVFDESLTWLQENVDKVTDQEILEAKLGVFQAIDAPVPPNKKGCAEFLRRLTPDALQRHRAEVMTVDAEGLKDVGEKFLGHENVLRTGKVVLGQKSDQMDVSNRPGELWTVIDTA